MTYASTSVDRRAQYYVRCAEVIAADPLDFYTRAERGRAFLARHFLKAVPRVARAMAPAESLRSELRLIRGGLAA